MAEGGNDLCNDVQGGEGRGRERRGGAVSPIRGDAPDYEGRGLRGWGRNAREGGGMRDSVGAEDGPMVRARPNTDDGKKGGNYGGEATGEDSEKRHQGK